jgi:aromatic-L-amino-acid/L-tryptophan decarboxylase
MAIMTDIHGGYPLEPGPEALKSLLEACSEFVAAHIGSLPAQHAGDTEGAAALARGFGEPAPEHGRPLGELLARLRPAIEKSFNTAGPGYLAFIPGGGLPTVALADLIGLAVIATWG